MTAVFSSDADKFNGLVPRDGHSSIPQFAARIAYIANLTPLFEMKYIAQHLELSRLPIFVPGRSFYEGLVYTSLDRDDDAAPVAKMWPVSLQGTGSAGSSDLKTPNGSLAAPREAAADMDFWYIVAFRREPPKSAWYAALVCYLLTDLLVVADNVDADSSHLLRDAFPDAMESLDSSKKSAGDLCPLQLAALAPASLLPLKILLRVTSLSNAVSPPVFLAALLHPSAAVSAAIAALGTLCSACLAAHAAQEIERRKAAQGL
jgi:hypothetical protein